MKRYRMHLSVNTKLGVYTRRSFAVQIESHEELDYEQAEELAKEMFPCASFSHHEEIAQPQEADRG